MMKVTAAPELQDAVRQCRSSFIAAGVFSLFVNLLLLLPAIYMLQIYDRVLPSSSEATLVMLTLIVAFLFLVMGALEWVRTQILVVTGTRLNHILGARVFGATFAQTVAARGRGPGSQPLQDLMQIKQFLTSPGIFAFFDAPWLPIYIAVMFLFHPLFGIAAILAAALLIGLAVWNQLATRAELEQANKDAIAIGLTMQDNLGSAEAAEAMGMLPRLRDRWQTRQLALLALQGQAGRKAGLIQALTRVTRLMIQSLMLGLGAWLAIEKEITPGVVVAGSILLGRALAPLDLMIGSWRSYLAARTAYHRLSELLRATPAAAMRMWLPPVKGAVSVERAVVVASGTNLPILKQLSFAVDAGTHLAIVGPSAAGKTTLVRAIAGLHPPSAGSIRLDGAHLDQWNREQLGPAIGYLPQDVGLLEGSIAENIARFGPPDPAKVVAAAEAAGIHEMILRLPDGYNMPVSGRGSALSGGQRQRIGLARALYGDPPLIILDEPNANLDREGDAALLVTLAGLKARGATLLIISHRDNVLRHVDQILVLVDGQIARAGPAAEVLAALNPTRIGAVRKVATESA